MQILSFFDRLQRFCQKILYSCFIYTCDTMALQKVLARYLALAFVVFGIFPTSVLSASFWTKVGIWSILKFLFEFCTAFLGTLGIFIIGMLFCALLRE